MSVSPPTPRQFWKLCITSCHRKPTSRRCKQTNTLCLHPPKITTAPPPIANERAGVNGSEKQKLKIKIKPQNGLGTQAATRAQGPAGWQQQPGGFV